MTDPIADLLTRIRNATRAGHSNLSCPRSNIKVEILRILKEEGFIEGYEEITDNKQGVLRVFPKYDKANAAVLRGIKRVSKPSRRFYVKTEDIPRVRNGLGIAILTTAQGVLTDSQAREDGVGGELICYVW